MWCEDLVWEGLGLGVMCLEGACALQQLGYFSQGIPRGGKGDGSISARADWIFQPAVAQVHPPHLSEEVEEGDLCQGWQVSQPSLAEIHPCLLGYQEADRWKPIL